jgi:hypothetical protein
VNCIQIEFPALSKEEWSEERSRKTYELRNAIFVFHDQERWIRSAAGKGNIRNRIWSDGVWDTCWLLRVETGWR